MASILDGTHVRRLLVKVLAELEPVDSTDEEETDTDVLLGRLRPREASEVKEWLKGDGPDVVEVRLDESVFPAASGRSKIK